MPAAMRLPIRELAKVWRLRNTASRCARHQGVTGPVGFDSPAARSSASIAEIAGLRGSKMLALRDRY